MDAYGWLIGGNGADELISFPDGVGAVRRYQRPAASTSASMSEVVRASTIAPSAPAACQRAHVSRGAVTHGESAIDSSREPLALEPDEDLLVLASLAGLGERLEVEREVRLEVVLERRPAVADSRRPAARRSPISPPMTMRRSRVRRGPGVRGLQRVERATSRVTGPPVHSARMTATASSTRATRSGAGGKSMP